MSISAIIASIEMITSLPISLVLDSACCASVSTADSTADLASSLLGLNSLFSSDAKSLPSNATPCNGAEDEEVSSAMVEALCE